MTACEVRALCLYMRRLGERKWKAHKENQRKILTTTTTYSDTAAQEANLDLTAMALVFLTDLAK